ncbi:MAG TPA: hypothetical protein VFH73_16285 [Polyangia bacterium]|nr:hypothetical protein [Polyangia bacterium]
MIRLAAAAAVALLSSDAAALSSAPRLLAPLQEASDGVTVDWGAGTLTTQAGAAPDLRMPSAELARPGSVRRARAAALARLKQALTSLPLGGERRLPPDAIERCLARARTAGVEYQSNGGAVVSLVVHFTDWLDTPNRASPPVPDGGVDADGGISEASAGPTPADVTISVPAARLSAAPLVKAGKHEVALGAACYRIGVPPASARAVPAKTDRTGRLVLDGSAIPQKLAGAVAVIYVQKVSK